MLDLTAVPDEALLAELARREAERAPPGVWFYGVWPGKTAGHGFYWPDGGDADWAVAEEFVRRNNRGLYPSGVVLRPSDRPLEGRFFHWQGDGEMLLTAWDRSADHRVGSCAAFLLDRVMAPALALKAARAAFPLVFERIETHLGRAVELAGPVEDLR